jgi:hypothetical protein
MSPSHSLPSMAPIIAMPMPMVDTPCWRGADE